MSESNNAIADLAKTLYESPKMFGGHVPANISSEQIAAAAGRTFWEYVPEEIRAELLDALVQELDFLRFASNPLKYQRCE